MMDKVVTVALVLSCLSFVVYVGCLIAALAVAMRSAPPRVRMHTDGTPAPPMDAGAVLTAFGGLLEILNKAKPAIAALAASLIFLLVAAACAWKGDV